MCNLKSYLKLIRPQQWLKNIFVFLPMFFGGSLFDLSDIKASVITFIAYSLTASSIYCFNDIIDLEADRCHPKKCKRPIASGEISLTKAVLLMIILFVSALLILFFSAESLNGMNVAYVICGYYILNLCYCVKLKQYAIIDVFIIAFGFVLRALAGSFATGVSLSHWLALMTFLIPLFLSFAKRRDDVLRMNETGNPPRKNTIRYNLTFINQAITITTSITMVCYVMYTVSPEVISRFGTDNLYLTSVFVLVGMLRYIQIAVVDEKSGDPTKVMLHDRFLQIVVFVWAMSFLFIIYFGHH